MKRKKFGKGGIVVDNDIRNEWNSYVGWLKQKGKRGLPELDTNGVGFELLEEYRGENPKTILTKDHIAPIQEDLTKYRNWAIEQHKLGKLKLNGDPGKEYENFMPGTSKIDGYPGSKTTSYSFPFGYLKTTEDGVTTTAGTGLAANKMAMGGQVGLQLAQSAPNILNSIMSLIEDDPSAYTTQPIMNASTMRNMVNPYKFAFGGTIDDLEEEELASVQEFADAQGMDIDQAFEVMNSMQQQEIEQGEEGEEFAYGGKTGRAVNVEGGEVIETPDGTVAQVKGPKHESGGVDMNLPVGTEVFSERLHVDGKTMKDRKLAREKRLAKFDDLMTKPYKNQLARNTIARGTEIIEQENEQDMMMQEAAANIYAAPKQKFAYGGRTRRNDYIGYMADYDNQRIQTVNDILGMQPNFIDGDVTGNSFNSDIPTIKPTIPVMKSSGIGNIDTPTSTASAEEDGGSGMGIGDILGLAGNTFNAVAPLINTFNNAKNTQPVINRYLGFGHEALDTNNAAMDYVDDAQTDALIDVDTTKNSSYLRNRNSASSVNTIRALDAISDMGANSARNKVRGNYSNQMMQLLGERGNITMRNDQMEAAGQTNADAANAQNLDNFYSNLGQNLTNFGTNVQGIGKNLNQIKSNEIDMNLISQLSKYGLAIDDEGNVINKKKK